MSQLGAFLERIGRTLPDVGLTVAFQLAVIVAATWLTLRFSRVFVRSLVRLAFERETREGSSQELSAGEVSRRTDTLAGLFADVLRIVILIAAFLTVLSTLRVDISPALAGLAAVALALGLGGNLLIRDYINGAFVLLENHYSVGDVVSVGGVTGVVEHFSLRRTTLRDLDGTVHVVPNGQISVASNLTREYAAIHLDLAVAFGADVTHAMEVIDEAGRALAADAAWRDRILEAPRALRASEIGDLGVSIKILGRVKAGDQRAATAEMRRRVLAAFAEAGIDVPRPRRVVIAREEVAPPRRASAKRAEKT